MSQSKNFLPGELKAYKKEVEALVNAGKLPSYASDSGALLRAKVHRVVAERLGTNGNLLVFLEVSNQGTRRTGLRDFQGLYHDSPLGTLRRQHRKFRYGFSCGPYRQYQETLSLEPKQVVEPGSLERWVVYIDEISALADDLGVKENFEQGLWEVTLEKPVEFSLSPICGSDILLRENHIHCSSHLYSNLFTDSEEWEDWEMHNKMLLAQERRSALQHPFLTSPGRLVPGGLFCYD